MAGASQLTPNRRAVAAAMVAAALTIVLQVAGKTTRDALYLSNYAAADLPKAMTGSAVLSVLGALGMGRLMTHFGPRRVVPLAFLANAALFCIDWAWVARSPTSGAFALYLHLGAMGPLLISGFWSLVNERFPPHRAKRYIGKISGSAAFGGVLGGVVAQQVTSGFAISAMFPVLAVLSGLGAAAVSLLSAEQSDSQRSAEVATSNSTGLRGAPYLQHLAALVLLTSLASGVLDFALKAQISETTESTEQMAAFFAMFHAIVGVLVFAVQSTMSSRVLRKLGLGGTIALLPAAIVASASVGAAVVRVWTVVLTKGLDALLTNSLYRAGYELLYTPVTPAQKRATKTAIDVVSDRIGDILAAALVGLSLLLFPDAAVRCALVIAAASGMVSLFLAMKLHAGYVQELTTSLRTGVLSAEDITHTDATTRRTLTDTTMAMDREVLLREIAALQAKKERSQGESSADDSPPPLSSSRPQERTEEHRKLLERTEALLVGSTNDRRKVLAQPDLQRELLPFILPLLADDALRREATQALYHLRFVHTGQLLDALLDPDGPIRVRRRLPKVLEHFKTLRVRDGLLLALEDPEFEVRYKAARSLLRLSGERTELVPDRSLVFSAVIRETAVSPQQWKATASVQDSQQSALPDSPERPAPRLQHVIVLLSTIFDREPLDLCLRAFTSGGDTVQGTAHEYLENILPGHVYRSLRPHLADTRRDRRTRRAKEHIVHDLNQSALALEFDRAALLRNS